VPDEAAQGERIGHAPRDPALRVQTLEVTNEQQPEVHPGRHARPAVPSAVEAPAEVFQAPVEAVLREQFVQPLVERVTRRLDDLRGGDPKIRLPLSLFASSHCHARILRTGWTTRYAE